MWKVVELPKSLKPFSPVAVNVQSLGSNVPPLSLVTDLTNLRVGAMSSLVMVQVLLSPGDSVILPSELQSPPQFEAL